MCGRFTLSTPPAVMAERYRFADSPPGSTAAQPPRYNIAPTQPVAIIRPAPMLGGVDADGPRELAMVSWGLVPSWSKEPRGGIINARAETLTEKPSFRDAFRSRRCLIPADGYFEWRKEGRQKQPYLFRRADRQPFVFAGLWELFVGPDGQPLETCAIITTEANELSAPIHDRVPAILTDDEADAWLDPATKTGRLTALLRPWDAAEFVCHPVGRDVNRIGAEGAGLVEEIAKERTLWSGA